MSTVSQSLATALAHHQAGQLQEAEQLYRQVLATEPEQADAWHLLGVLASQVGRHSVAVEYISRAVVLRDHDPSFHRDLGAAFKELGKLDESIGCYRQAIERRSNWAEAYNDLGVALTDQDNAEEGIACYRRAIELKPDLAQAHSNLGIALRDQKKPEEAAACHRRALELRPDLAAVHTNLANALKDLGQLGEAIECHRKALELKPDFAQAHANLGNCLRERGDADAAAACYHRAIEFHPAFVEAYVSLGNVMRDEWKLDTAVACFRKALELNPDHAEAHNQLGLALARQGILGEAAAACQRAIELKPDYVEAHCNLATIFHRLGKPSEAAGCIDQVLQFQDDDPESQFQLANALKDQARYQEAVAWYRRVLKRKPDSVQAQTNLGIALEGQGKFKEALACYERAIGLKADCVEAHHNRGLIYLKQGDYERGWPDYEWRWRLKYSPQRNFAQPEWDGSDLAGKRILIYAEQGLGDTIHFVRYLPLVRARGGCILFHCRPALHPLLSGFLGIDELVDMENQPFDTHAPLISLPHLLGLTHPQQSPQPPYLFANANLTAKWKAELDQLPGFRIGITWQGNPKFPEDRQRSIPLQHFLPLAGIRGVQLISLQKGYGREQLEQSSAREAFVDLGSRLDESTGAFLDTAAALESLDLVITSDTAVAHVAGALGRPVWVALSKVPDWRWTVSGETTAWYPTMRLFRQKKQGDWLGVFRQIERALRKETAKRRQSGRRPV